jgi:hypothetical protein
MSQVKTPITAAEVERGHAKALKTATYLNHSRDDTLLPVAIETFGTLVALMASLIAFEARILCTTRRSCESQR